MPVRISFTGMRVVPRRHDSIHPSMQNGPRSIAHNRQSLVRHLGTATRPGTAIDAFVTYR
jgi:hypothetical protein